MEESKNGKNNVCKDCCNHCEHCTYQKNYFLRWVLGIIVMLLVFWLGVTVGKFSGFIQYGEFGGYGMRGMMKSGYYKGVPANNFACPFQNQDSPALGAE